MITILTTAKPFVGQMGTNQINALKSWKAACPGAEILLFGTGEGYAEVTRQLGIIHVGGVETSPQGTPIYNSMFAYAQAHGRYPLQVFLSCDNILLGDFLPAIARITWSRFLLIGQRWDLDLNREINFEHANWAEELRHELTHRGTLHPPTGSDYFVYRGDLWAAMPPVVVGRAGDDGEIIYYCRTSRVPVVDISACVTVVHQNHDYGHHAQGVHGVWNGPEAQMNHRPYRRLGLELTTLDAGWRLLPKCVSRNYCRGDWDRYLQVTRLLHPGTLRGELAGAARPVARRAQRLRARLGGMVGA